MYKYEKERELVNALFRRLSKGRWYLMKLEHGGILRTWLAIFFILISLPSFFLGQEQRKYLSLCDL